MPKKSADDWFAEYGECHQNAINKLVHWVCVPAIVVSLLGLVWSLPRPAVGQGFAYLNWATVLVFFAMLFYVRLSPALAAGMFACVAPTCVLLNRLDQLDQPPLWQASLVVFVLAWVGQFIGHQIEGKRPSFFKDVQFLLIGPIWLLAFVYRRIGIPY